MTTWSGHAYKTMAEINCQEMLLGLAEDRRKYNEEIGGKPKSLKKCGEEIRTSQESLQCQKG